MKKILFILKERFYQNDIHVNSYGLINSSKHLARYIEELKCETKVVTVIDSNGIDKVVNDFKPDIVVIEALWVTAIKLKELIEIKKYRNIEWIVRIHSDIGFLGVETFALKYVNDYINLHKHNLILAPNNRRFTEYLSNAMQYKFTYLPNVIDIAFIKKPELENSHVINIASFGALRILKNQLFQAICAIKAADILGKTLHFHIMVNTKDYSPTLKNTNTLNPVLVNFEQLFAANSKHSLVKHHWMENDDFQKLVQKMDLGLQLSFTESFNIVAADFINNDTPILVSDVIDWMPCSLKTSTTEYDEVSQKIVKLYKNRNSYMIKRRMRASLIKYDVAAKIVWIDFIHKYHHDHDRDIKY